MTLCISRTTLIPTVRAVLDNVTYRILEQLLQTISCSCQTWTNCQTLLNSFQYRQRGVFFKSALAVAALGTSPNVAVCLTGKLHSTTDDSVPARYLTRRLLNYWLHGRIHCLFGRTSGQFHLNFRKMALESVRCEGSVMLVALTQHHISTLILYHDLTYHPGIVCRSIFTCTSGYNRVLWLQKVGGGSTYQNHAQRSRRNKRFRPDACNWTQHGPFAVSSLQRKTCCSQSLNSGLVAVRDGTEHRPVCLCTVCVQSVLHVTAYKTALLWTAIDWRQSAFSWCYYWRDHRRGNWPWGEWDMAASRTACPSGEEALYRCADKSLARLGRKQANVSLSMGWHSFGALPYRKNNLMTAHRSMLLKSRASLTCFRACFLPGRAKDLSAPGYFENCWLCCNTLPSV